MLGIGGKFASSKGMVAMPNLSNLTRSQAIDAIQQAGLRLGNAQSSSTSNQSQDQKVSSQAVVAGTLLDYETAVSFSYLNYVAPPVPQGPTVTGISSTGCIEYGGRVEIDRDCNTSTKIGTVVYGFRRHNVTTISYSDGSIQQSTVECTNSDRTERGTIYNCDDSIDCDNYIRTYSETDVASQCSTGYARYNVGVFRDGCGKSNVVTFQFCTTNPNTIDCNSCVSSYNYRTSDAACASGTAWRSVCTKPAGCSPATIDVKGGCDPVVVQPPTPSQPAQPVCRTSCTPWYRSSCQSDGQRFVTRRCSDCNGNNEYRETYYESC